MARTLFIVRERVTYERVRVLRGESHRPPNPLSEREYEQGEACYERIVAPAKIEILEKVRPLTDVEIMLFHGSGSRESEVD